MKFDTDFIASQLALAKSATPRPWKWEAVDASMVDLGGPDEEDDYVLSCTRCEACIAIERRCHWPTKEDSALIVSAVNNWTDALAEIKRLQDQLRWIPVSEIVITPDDLEYETEFEAAIYYERRADGRKLYRIRVVVNHCGKWVTPITHEKYFGKITHVRRVTPPEKGVLA